MAPVFAGVGVALVTLVDDDDALDVPATSDLAVRLVELGMRAPSPAHVAVPCRPNRALRRGKS